MSTWSNLLRVWVVLGFMSVASEAATNRFEGEVQALEAAARRTPPSANVVMLYGSSSFRLWTNVAGQFPRHAIVNYGFGGSQLSDLNEFFERLVVPVKPRLLLIYGGDNDIASGKSPDRVLTDFRRLVQAVRERTPRTRVGFVAIKPSPSRAEHLKAQREANRIIREFAGTQRRVDFLDTATPLLNAAGRPDEAYFVNDRLHLNDAGYARWMRVLGPYVDAWGARK